MGKLRAKRIESKSPLSGIVGGAFSLTLSTIILKILGLIYKIPLANLLGDEGMGYFNSAYTVYAFFYLLCTAGVPKAVMILISEARAKGRRADEYTIVKTAISLFSTIGLFVFALFVLLATPLANMIGNSKSALTMLSIAPSIIIISIAGVIRGYLTANMKLLDIATSQIIEGVSKLVVGLLLATYAKMINLPVQIASALTILGVSFGSLVGLVYLFVTAKINKTKQIAGQKTNFSVIVRRIFGISVPITLSAAVMSLTNIIDLGLIMKRLTSIGYTEQQASALYGNYTTLAVPMFNLAIAIITPISIAHLPVIITAFTQKDREMLLQAKKSSLELTSFITAPVMIGLFVFAEEILSVLYKNSSVEVGATLLRLLCPAIFFSGYLIIVNTVLEAYGCVKATVISMGIGGFVKIFVGYFLISNQRFGIFGAPIGTVISYSIALIVSIIIYGVKYDDHLPILRYGITMYLFAGAAVAVAKIVYKCISQKFSDILSLSLSILLGAAIYLMLSMLMGGLTIGKYRKLANYTKHLRKNYKIRRKAIKKI